MIWYKSCPRCEKGDMILDEDNYKNCLQCGYVQYSATQLDISNELVKLLQFLDGSEKTMVGELRRKVAAVAL